MSPFSKFLRKLRDSRGLKQKEFAALLGYEQSYVSSLERSAKGAPRRSFVDLLIRKMNLDEAEVLELERTFSASGRRFTLATNASFEEYQLWGKLQTLSGKLDPIRWQLIMAVLELPSASPLIDELAPGQSRGIERRSTM